MKESNLVLGVFDGIHLGHKKLLETAKNKNRNLIVITFNFENKGDLIFKIKERVKFLKLYGVDKVIVVDFNKDIANKSVESFLSTYIKEFNVKELFIGEDFKAGVNRAEDAFSIKKSLPIAVTVVETKKNRTNKISSSDIKQSIMNGDFKYVNNLLIFPYYIKDFSNKIFCRAIKRSSRLVYPKNGLYSAYFYYHFFRIKHTLNVTSKKIILFKIVGLKPLKIEFIVKLK